MNFYNDCRLSEGDLLVTVTISLVEIQDLPLRRSLSLTWAPLLMLPLRSWSIVKPVVKYWTALLPHLELPTGRPGPSRGCQAVHLSFIYQKSKWTVGADISERFHYILDKKVDKEIKWGSITGFSDVRAPLIVCMSLCWNLCDCKSNKVSNA